MRSRRSLTFSLGDLVFERPKKFMMDNQGGMVQRRCSSEFQEAIASWAKGWPISSC
jgi:hypothetical protein